MRRSLAILFVVASLGTASAARADKYNDDCRVPMADWQPRAKVEQMAAEQGLTVRRIRIDDGCYEIRGRDATGREVEIKLDPATLTILKIEYEDSHDD